MWCMPSPDPITNSSACIDSSAWFSRGFLFCEVSSRDPQVNTTANSAALSEMKRAPFETSFRTMHCSDEDSNIHQWFLIWDIFLGENLQTFKITKMFAVCIELDMDKMTSSRSSCIHNVSSLSFCGKPSDDGRL
ncbi:hypothetical protein SRHO_G00103540 [Serrasalmus rhombeus]